MYEKLSSDGLSIAPGVVETIVSLAVGQLEGVAQVKAPNISDALLSAVNRKHPAQGVIITAEDDGQIIVTIHAQLYYGCKLQEVAERIRVTVADTLEGQVGIEVARVDVVVDGIQFPE